MRVPVVPEGRALAFVKIHRGYVPRMKRLAWSTRHRRSLLAYRPCEWIQFHAVECSILVEVDITELCTFDHLAIKTAL